MLSLRRSVLFPLWPLERWQPGWTAHRAGLWGERAVARWLWKRGHRLLEHRWRGPRRTDIDLVAAAPEHLLFAEVKLRGPGDEDPWATVFDQKRMQLLRVAAGAYLHHSGQQHITIRFHAFLVLPDPARPRHPRITVEEDYLNPRSIPGWRGVSAEEGG